jgi:hypothetical protein
MLDVHGVAGRAPGQGRGQLQCQSLNAIQSLQRPQRPLAIAVHVQLSQVSCSDGETVKQRRAWRSHRCAQPDLRLLLLHHLAAESTIHASYVTKATAARPHAQRTQEITNFSATYNDDNVVGHQPATKSAVERARTTKRGAAGQLENKDSRLGVGRVTSCAVACPIDCSTHHGGGCRPAGLP